MPLVTMHMYPGRTPEQKAGVVRGITDAVVRELGVPASSVEVLLIEVPREHWAFAGNLASQQAPVSSNAGR
jgi:4-oxalocrotonate tautomerase